MKKPKFLFIMIFLVAIFSLTGCQLNVNSNDTRPQVVTTIFPLYDFTKQIAGDKVNVQLILPPGVEPHSFEPKPRAIFEMRRANLFIYTGSFLEPWANKIINVLDEDKVTIIKSSQGVPLLTGDMEEHTSNTNQAVDPHIWMNPKNDMIIVDNILKGLIQIDPKNKDYYTENAIQYKKQLQSLDNEYQDLFTHVKYKTIIFGGHFVLGYLAYEYHLDYVTPYKGFSPDALPTPTKIEQLISLINKTGEKYIFYEELINPKVAKVIAEQTGVKMLSISGAGNVSKEEMEKHLTFIDIMHENINNLKVGLEYNEG